MATQLAAASRGNLEAAGVLRGVRPANVKVRSGVDLAREDPWLLSGFYSLALAHPADEFTITSGARDKAPASGPYPIAPSSRSFHNPAATGTGLAEALDAIVNGRPVADELGANELALFGLHAGVAGDPVHVTRIGWNG